MNEKYKWDIEALNDQLQVLRREKENLENSRQFLGSLKTEVQENWVSLAGNTYTGSLQIDLQLYEKMIEALDGGIVMLDKIANQTYTACEYEVQKKLTSMASNMVR